MLGYPVLCAKSEEKISITALTPIIQKSGVEEGYDESRLQEIVDRCPDVLAIRDFLPSAKFVVSLGREIPVDLGGRPGYIDNLLVTDKGDLVIVETKLWRNPQALREVVAQVLHYGMAVMALSVPALEHAIRKGDSKSENRLSDGESIFDRISDKFGIHEESAVFDNRLEQNIRSGEMLFLIVGDGVHLSVERFTSWLRDFKALPFQLGLIELRFFSAPPLGAIVVPRTLLKTKEIARHVVKIEMSAETSSQVKIVIEDRMEEEGGGSIITKTPIQSATRMDESRLIAATNIEAGSKSARFVSDLISFLVEAGFDRRESPTELAFGVQKPGNGEFLSLLHLLVSRMYASQGKRVFELVGIEAVLQHRRMLNRLASLYSTEAVEHIDKQRWKGCLMPKFDSMTCTAQEMAEEFIRFRDLVLQRMQSNAAA